MVTMDTFDKLIEILFGDKYSVGMWKRSILGRFRFRFHFVVQILVAIPFSKLEAVNRFHIPSINKLAFKRIPTTTDAYSLSLQSDFFYILYWL